MNKTLVFCLIFFLGIGYVCAQKVNFPNIAQNQHVVQRKNDSKIHVYSLISNLNHFEIVRFDTVQDYLQISIPSYTYSNEIGYPKLPVKVDIIELPQGASYKIVILSSKYKELDLNDLGFTQFLFPVQLPRSKSQKTPLPFQKFSKIYESDSLYAPELVSIVSMGKMRNVNLAKVITSPIQYFPKLNRLRVYYDLEYEIVFENQIRGSYDQLRYRSSEFSALLNQHLANAKHADRDNAPLGYVLISDPMYKDSLQAFIKWKKSLGYNVIQAYTSDPAVGKTSASIHKYLKAIYDGATPENPAPTFLLLVGDVAQIPQIPSRIPVNSYLYPSNHPADMYYGEFTGDVIPDMFVGRFSANTVSDLVAQVEKVIFMEKNGRDFNFLDTTLLVAGYDLSYGENHLNKQMNYAQSLYFNDNNGVHSIKYLFPESKNKSSNIVNDINKGVGLYSYSGHGVETGLSNPILTADMVNTQLTNKNKYAVIFANCCLTANYSVPLCLGEAFLRAPKKGAVGFIGGSNYTYFDEDLYWTVGVNDLNRREATYETSGLGIYDKLWHTHGESTNDWVSSLGKILFDGNMIVAASNSVLTNYYWEVYHVLGDPSYLLPLKRKRELSIQYPDTIHRGSSKIVVLTDPNTYVSIQDTITVLGGVYTDATGRGEIEFTDLGLSSYINLSAHIASCVPFKGIIHINEVDAPFVKVVNYALRDQNDQLLTNLEYGKEYKIDIELKNIGKLKSEYSVLKMESSHPLCILNLDSIIVPALQSNESKLFSAAFSVSVSSKINNGEELVLTLLSTLDGETMDTKKIKTRVFAPNFEFAKIEFENAPYNYLQAGMKVTTSVFILNNGRAKASNVNLEVESLSENIEITASKMSLDSIAVNFEAEFIFECKVAENVQKGSPYLLKFLVKTMGKVDTLFYYSLIGPHVESFESNEFDQYTWNFNEHPWEITDSTSYEGNFSAQSGLIGDLEKSIIKLKWDCVVDDSIRFARKTSTERYNQSQGDFLYFYIDSVEQGKWAGILEWNAVAFAVSKGIHEFKWVYSKDLSQKRGSDKVWIDEIILPRGGNILSTEREIENSYSFDIQYASKTTLKLKFSHYIDGEIMLLNTMGKLVAYKKVKGNEAELPIEMLTSGAYLCILKFQEKIEARKFWKTGNL